MFNSCGRKCAIDSDYRRARNEYLIKSSRTLPDDPESIIIDSEATSLRQLAERGMHTSQSSFPGIKEHIPYEKRGGRQLILKILVILYNYCLNTVGFNQLCN